MMGINFAGMGVVTLPDVSLIPTYKGYPGSLSVAVNIGGQNGSLYLSGTETWWTGSPTYSIDTTPFAWIMQAARSYVGQARGPTIMDPAIGAALEVKVEQISGTTPNYAGMTFGSWLPLYHSGVFGYAFGYTCTVTGINQEDYKSGTFKLSLRFAGTTTVLASANFNFAVDANTFGAHL